MEEECDGCRILIYNEGDLVACFDKNISGEAIKHIAKMGPSRAVFMDGRFQSSAEKINLLEMFKILSPKTRVKVI